jgi:hypothetical protein
MIPLLAVLLAVGVVKARMQTRVIYHHHLMHVLGNLGQMIWHAIMQALQFNLWAYGLRMPVLLGRLYQLGALSATALWVAAMIAIFVAAYLWRYMEPDQMPHMREWLRLAGVGFFLFFLGFVFFFNNTDYDFSSAGIANRVAIASALGTGCIAVAVVGLVTGILPRRELRNAAFSVAIGIVCGANCLAMSGIAWHWHQAAMRQREVLDSMRQDLSPLPHSSVLLQDGYCRYVGPAVVFDGDWDSTGALRVLTGDHSLLSDVVSPDLRFERYAVITPLPEEDERNYPYSNHLFVYNVKYRVLRALPDKSAADAYLRAFNPSGDGGCPFGKEGYGTKAF